MNQFTITMENLTNCIGYGYENNDNHEDEQVSIAEGHDEFRNRIIGNNLRQQTGLTGPAKLIIFSSQLHPKLNLQNPEEPYEYP